MRTLASSICVLMVTACGVNVNVLSDAGTSTTGSGGSAGTGTTAASGGTTSAGGSSSTAAGGTSASGQSCNDLQQTAQTAFNSFVAAHQSCTTDNDCSTAGSISPCVFPCLNLMNTASAASAVTYSNQLCSDFFAQGCPAYHLSCITGPVACNSGTCEYTSAAGGSSGSGGTGAGGSSSVTGTGGAGTGGTSGVTSNLVTQTLSACGIPTTGSPSVTTLDVPSSLTGLYWDELGPICQQGGWDLTLCAGQSATFTSLASSTTSSSGNPITINVASVGNTVCCIYAAEVGVNGTGNPVPCDRDAGHAPRVPKITERRVPRAPSSVALACHLRAPAMSAGLPCSV